MRGTVAKRVRKQAAMLGPDLPLVSYQEGKKGKIVKFIKADGTTGQYRKPSQVTLGNCQRAFYQLIKKNLWVNHAI